MFSMNVYLFLCFLCCILFDVAYFLRSFIFFVIYTWSSLLNKRSLEHDIDMCDICLTTDLDNLWHMNNSRYLRESDFARMKFFIVTQIWRSLFKAKASLVNAGNSIRYRKSIELFDFFRIRTKLIYWDDRAFYVEQQFIRQKDSFICAVNIAKIVVKNSTPQYILKDVSGYEVSPPALTSELQKLLESWQLSSEKLRKSS